MKRGIYPIIVILFSAIFCNCEKENEHQLIKYQISNAVSEVSFSYRINNGNLKEESILFNSKEDIWKYTFEANKGDIVYISARYTDSISSVTATILINGKIYKQGLSNNEPNKYVTVSGVVPY
ncbi:MAG: hypothetical protein K8R53_08150 [Bacteroidales bacterium]|nr:hypothetical protein [Bacteroidales bacterium]